MSDARSQPPGSVHGKGTPSLWRHALTVLWIAIACTVVAPIIGTVLLALRFNGLSFDLLYAPVLSPMTTLYAGPAAFGLGLVFGWMLLGLVLLGLNLLILRLALAMLVASLAWSLADPLPLAEAAHGGWDMLLDWLVLNATAAATAALFTCGWLERRAHPAPSD